MAILGCFVGEDDDEPACRGTRLDKTNIQNSTVNLRTGVFLHYTSSNVDKEIVNHPQIYHVYIGCINHQPILAVYGIGITLLTFALSTMLNHC